MSSFWKFIRHWTLVITIFLSFYILVLRTIGKSGVVDVQLHDTYIVLGCVEVAVLATVILHLIFAFFYQWIVKWKKPVVNWTQVVLLFLFNLIFYQTIYLFWFMIRGLLTINLSDNGWTITPEQLLSPDLKLYEPSVPWYNYLLFVTLVLLPSLYLAYCAYRSYKSKRLNL